MATEVTRLLADRGGPVVTLSYDGVYRSWSTLAAHATLGSLMLFVEDTGSYLKLGPERLPLPAEVDLRVTSTFLGHLAWLVLREFSIDGTKLISAVEHLHLRHLEDRRRNSLVVCSVPSPEGRGAQLYLPYFLLPLPKTAICDILHGRMIIFSLVNSGRVSEALENEGFEVRYPTGRNDLSAGSMVVTMELEHDGQRYRAEWHNLQMHLDEMVMEFKPLSYIVDVARAMRDNMVVAIEHRAAARRNDGSEVA